MNISESEIRERVAQVLAEGYVEPSGTDQFAFEQSLLDRGYIYSGSFWQKLEQAMQDVSEDFRALKEQQGAAAEAAARELLTPLQVMTLATTIAMALCRGTSWTPEHCLLVTNLVALWFTRKPNS